MRLLVSGGGSAGHVLPALAVLEELKGAEILYVGSHGGPDARLVAGKYPYKGIFTGKLRRYGRASWLHPWLILQNLGDAFLLFLGTVQSLWVVWRFRPDAVFCNGGFTSVPVALAAAALKKPILIQEADQAFGVANSILRRVATKVALAYQREDPDPRAVVTGNPIRSDLLGAAQRPLPAEFDLPEDLPLVLVMGGTKGARRINRALFAGLVQLLDKAVVVHLTGSSDNEAAVSVKDRLSKAQQSRYFPIEFLAEGYPELLARASIVITRAGAGSLWESAALQKPMIVIPITHSANNHQQRNAEYFASRGGAEVLPESQLSAGHLVPRILELLDHPQKLVEMGERAKGSIVPDAAARIAELLTEMGMHSSDA